MVCERPAPRHPVKKARQRTGGVSDFKRNDELDLLLGGLSMDDKVDSRDAAIQGFRTPRMESLGLWIGLRGRGVDPTRAAKAETVILEDLENAAC